MADGRVNKKPTPRKLKEKKAPASTPASSRKKIQLPSFKRAKGSASFKSDFSQKLNPKKQQQKSAQKKIASAPFVVASPADKRVQRQTKTRSFATLKNLKIAAGLVAACAVLFFVATFILSHTSAFQIKSIKTQSTAHIEKKDIIKLANIKDGTTLLNIDTAAIAQNLKRNPWVKEVSFTRQFPSTLGIKVKERKVDMLVVMNAQDIVWCVGDGFWIEPIAVDAGQDGDLYEAALNQAQQMNALTVSDVPADISPEAGKRTKNTALLAVEKFQKGFSDSFSSQISSYFASGVSSISCTLTNGITISLGKPEDISTKEKIAKALIEKYPDRLTYINVRVPSDPSYRMIDSENVESNTKNE